MPCLPGWHNMHAVQLQLGNSRLDQSHMGRVRWIKRSAENTQTLDDCVMGLGLQGGVQTQALGTKKWLSRRASGEPGSAWR